LPAEREELFPVHFRCWVLGVGCWDCLAENLHVAIH
jgi:hypothetical protein